MHYGLIAKYIFLIIFVFTGLEGVKSQPTLQWQKCLGGSSGDYGRVIRQTFDGGYIVGGRSHSTNGDVTGNHDTTGLYYDFWVAKINSTGTLQWQISLGGSYSEDVNDIIQTRDSGFVVAGYANSKDGDITGNHDSAGVRFLGDYFVVRLTAQGSVIWKKVYGGLDRDSANSILQTDDGGFLIAGHSTSDISGNKTIASWDPNLQRRDYWVIKIDSLGNFQWDKLYGSLGDDQLYDGFQKTMDGGYILGGTCDDSIGGDKTDTSRGDLDFWVVKVDSQWNIQWDKTYGALERDALWSIKQTTDSGYIMVGYSYSGISGEKTETNHDPTLTTTDYWLVKTDKSGNVEWDRSLGGSENDFPYCVRQTSDGGFIAAGRSNSFDGDVTNHYGCFNDSGHCADYWIVKTDASGNIEWDRSYGGTGGEWANWIEQTDDDGFVITGFTFSYDSNVTGNHGSGDFWIVKLLGPPVSAFTASSTSLCEGDCINFQNNSTGASSYQWDFGDGGTSTDPNPSYCYTNPGTFTVTLVASNGSLSDTEIRTNYITVNETPSVAVAGVDQTDDSTCGVTSVPLNAENPSVGSGMWSIVSGTGGSFANANIYNTSFSGVSGNSYTLCWTVSNNPCPASQDTMLVTFNQLPVVLITNIPYGPYCMDQQQVAITALPTGGTLSGNGITGNQFYPSAAGAGNHNISYSYINTAGCTGSDMITIVVNPVPSASISSQQNVLCHGDSSGSATISVSSGTAPYDYLWSPGGGTTATVSNLWAETYSVIVTDDNGCDDTTQVVITEPSTFISLTTSSTPAGCGLSDGTATVIASGGAGSYTYSWNTVPVQTTVTATNLASGIYTVVVTDASGCTESTSISVTNSTGPSVILGTVTNVTCYDGNDGAASVTATGVNPPFTYSWFPTGGTSANASNLLAGIYTVTVTDSLSCVSSIDSIVVSQPPQIVAVAGSDTSTCPGSILTIGGLASGGTGSLSYSWDPPGGLNSSTVASPTANPVSTTTYTVTVTDANSCTGTDTILITLLQLPVVTVSPQDTSVCPGSTVQLVAGPGLFGYAWSNGDTGMTTYVTIYTDITIILTGTDANGCSDTAHASITASGGGVFPTAILTQENYYNSSQPNDTLCDLTANFNLGVTPGGTLHYDWQITDIGGLDVDTFYMSPDSSHIVFSPDSVTANQFYFIQLVVTDSSGGCAVTLRDTVFVEDDNASVDDIQIWHHENGSNHALVCLDNTADYYQWGYDDPVSWTPHPAPGQTFQDYLFTINDPFDPVSKYYWVMTYYDSCFTKVYYIGPFGGRNIYNISFKDDLTVYPNPNNGQFLIAPDRQVSGTLSIEVLNELGSRVLLKHFHEREFPGTGATIDLSNAADGIYLVKVWDERHHYSPMKVIKQAAGK